MKRYKRSLLAAPWLFAGLSMPTQADDTFKFSGFASFVGGTFSEENYGYAGYTDEISFSPDSVIGLQIGAQVSDNVTVTTQLVAKGISDYDVEAELAYLTYAVSRDWDIRAGKIRTPFFYYSDFLDVGYAYPWVRPPVDVYRVLLFSFDGIDTIYRRNHGDWSSTWQVFYGNTQEDIDSPTLGVVIETEADDLMGVNVQLENDWLTLWAGYVGLDLTQSLTPPTEAVFEILNAQGFTDMVNDFDSRIPKKVDYIALAALVDYEGWLFNAEYTSTTVDRANFFLNDEAWFVMMGRRLGDVTVHLTYTTRTEDPDFERNQIPEDNPLHIVVDSAFLNIEDSSLTAGIRYDLDTGIALKAEVSRFDRDIAEPLFPGQDNGLDTGILVNFGIDLVF